MYLTIHRGSHEIAGTCIELESEKSKILIDFGLPLVDQNREPFDSRKIKNKSKDNLIKSGILPSIRGLYKDEKAKPFIENYLALVIKQALLNQLEEKTQARYRFHLEHLLTVN